MYVRMNIVVCGCVCEDVRVYMCGLVGGLGGRSGQLICCHKMECNIFVSRMGWNRKLIRILQSNSS